MATEISVLKEIRDSLNGGVSNDFNPAVPELTVIENTSSSPINGIISNKKLISIVIKRGTGLILGTVVDNAIASIDLPYLSQGWADVSYTVDPNSTFVIFTGV